MSMMLSIRTSETSTPASSGESICDAACEVCIIPLARPKCCFGTSSVVAAVKAGYMKVLKTDLTMTKM